MCFFVHLRVFSSVFGFFSLCFLRKSPDVFGVFISTKRLTGESQPGWYSSEVPTYARAHVGSQWGWLGRTKRDPWNFKISCMKMRKETCSSVSNETYHYIWIYIYIYSPTGSKQGEKKIIIMHNKDKTSCAYYWALKKPARNPSIFSDPWLQWNGSTFVWRPPP